MDFTAAIPTFVVTLREGMEVSLIVGIVLACLNKSHQSDLNRWIYGGVFAGTLGSLLIGLFLGLGLQQVQGMIPSVEAIIKPLLETLFCSIAIIMLSWMLIWMTQQARSLKGELEGVVQSALLDADQAGWSLFSLICIAVLREGFETVLFLFANLQQSPNQGLMALTGAIAGILTAVGLGVALFQWGIKINLRLFFQVMGVLLLLIMAGLVIAACKHLDAAFLAISQLEPARLDLCFGKQSCILGPLLWDTSDVLPDKRLPGILLKVFLGYRDHIYLGQLLAYGAFGLGIGGRYFRSLRGNLPTAAAPTPSTSQ